MALLILAIIGTWLRYSADTRMVGNKTVDEWTRALLREGATSSQQIPFNGFWNPQNSEKWKLLARLGEDSILVYCKLSLIGTSPPRWKDLYDQATLSLPILPKFNWPQNPLPQVATHELMRYTFNTSSKHAGEVAWTLAQILDQQTGSGGDYESEIICNRLALFGPIAHMALPALESKFRKSPRFETRAAALSAIAEISPGTSKTLSAVKDGLNDSSERTRVTAAALGLREESLRPRVLAVLKESVQSNQPYHAQLALRAGCLLVGMTRSNQTVLELALKNRNLAVKRQAADFLFTHESRTNLFLSTLAEFAVSDSEEVQSWAVDGAKKLADVNAEARRLLYAVTESSPPRVAARAVGVFATLKTSQPEDLAILQRAMQHPWRMVREEATNCWSKLQTVGDHADSFR